MKNLILFLIVLVTSTSNYAQNELILLFGDDNIIKDVKLYYDRVKADGGGIADTKDFYRPIKLIKSKNYLDSLVFWVSSSGGMKRTGDSVLVLYELRGNDLLGEINSYPLFSKDEATEEDVIKFLGSNFLSTAKLEVQQPFTLVLAIKQNEPIDNETIFNSYSANDYSLIIDKKNELAIIAGKKLKTGMLSDSKDVIMIEFNGDNSKIYINNSIAATGKLDQLLLKGILFGKNNKNNPDYFSGDFYDCGIFNTIISDDLRTSLFQRLK